MKNLVFHKLFLKRLRPYHYKIFQDDHFVDSNEHVNFCFDLKPNFYKEAQKNAKSAHILLCINAEDYK